MASKIEKLTLMPLESLDVIKLITSVDVSDNAKGLVLINGEKYVLVRLNNKYFIAKGNKMTPIDGRKINRPASTIKRKTVMEGGGKVNVYLDEKTKNQARYIGNGCVSRGIRVAVETFDQNGKQDV